MNAIERMLGEVEAARAEEMRLSTRLEEAHRVIAVLVRRLGGETVLTGLELLHLPPRLTFFSQPAEDGGLRIAVREC